MQTDRRANPISDCPLTAALAATGGKWKMIIIYLLADRPLHLAALKQEMSSVSQKVLVEQLRELAADEIIARDETGPPPAPVYYSLTEYGRSLLPVVDIVRRWGRGHIEHFRA